MSVSTTVTLTRTSGSGIQLLRSLTRSEHELIKYTSFDRWADLAHNRNTCFRAGLHDPFAGYGSDGDESPKRCSFAHSGFVLAVDRIPDQWRVSGLKGYGENAISIKCISPVESFISRLRVVRAGALVRATVGKSALRQRDTWRNEHEGYINLSRSAMTSHVVLSAFSVALASSRRIAFRLVISKTVMFGQGHNKGKSLPRANQKSTIPE